MTMTFEQWIENEGWVHSYIDMYTQCSWMGDGIISFSKTTKELKREYKQYCKKNGIEPKENNNEQI